MCLRNLQGLKPCRLSMRGLRLSLPARLRPYHTSDVRRDTRKDAHVNAKCVRGVIRLDLEEEMSNSSAAVIDLLSSDHHVFRPCIMTALTKTTCINSLKVSLAFGRSNAGTESGCSRGRDHISTATWGFHSVEGVETVTCLASTHLRRRVRFEQNKRLAD